MYKRTISSKLKQLAESFSVVTITGPRQSGKTTCAKTLFSNHEYINLENPEEREFAQTDPKGFLNRFKGRVILDEIQRVPQLLSYIQVIVDERDLPGQFILTGSQQFHLLEKVTQSLAGRTALLTLMPLSLGELLQRKPRSPETFRSSEIEIPPPPPFSLADILFKGLYPRIHDKHLDAHQWLSAYYGTYVERDVREVLNIGNLETFQMFVRLCAGRNGQILNLTSLGNDCGVSHTTARQWISVLQAGGIIHLLQPHYANFSKRLIKSPKLYFLDTGLLCYLLRIRHPSEIVTHALKGSIFESFVLSEIYKVFSHHGEAPPLYYWRDRTGHEVDLILDYGNQLFPLECKAGETLTESYFQGLRYYLSLKKNPNQTGGLIYSGNQSLVRNGFHIFNWFQCS